jgi:hypothetical protein
MLKTGQRVKLGLWALVISKNISDSKTSRRGVSVISDFSSAAAYIICRNCQCLSLLSPSSRHIFAD